MSKHFALIGPGRVGSAITKALFENGYHPVAIIGRSLESTREACSFIGCNQSLATTDLRAAEGADLILLAVPDDQIATVAAQLQQHLTHQDRVLIHFSGVHTAAIMGRPEGQSSLFSLHPLLPFADRQQAYERLSLAPYFGEGDGSAYPVAEAVCKALGGQLQAINSQTKHLYHAAACLASNYLVTLIEEAAAMLNECGIEQSQGVKCLLPLLDATLHNVAICGTKEALTGPIIRGDIGTLTAHLQALEAGPTDLLDLYCLLGNRTLLLAESSGRLCPGKAKTIHNLFNKKYLTNKNT